jgi:hypothetical protein
MTDLRHLHDAFEELERRADAAGATSAAVPKPRRTFRLAPVAATVVAVAGLAAGAVWLSPGNDTAPAGTRAATQPSTTAPVRHEVPTTPDELVARFRTVLGDTATFEVRDTAGGPVVMIAPPPPSSSQTAPPAGDNTPAGPTQLNPGDAQHLPGAFINGTLTTAAGVKGGFDLQIYANEPGSEQVFCDDQDKANCSITTLADGSQLAIGQTTLEGDGVTYMANLVRPDGSVLLMHVSNRADPKGAGDVTAPAPPFTTEELTTLVTSALWW